MVDKQSLVGKGVKTIGLKDSILKILCHGQPVVGLIPEAYSQEFLHTEAQDSVGICDHIVGLRLPSRGVWGHAPHRNFRPL